MGLLNAYRHLILKQYPTNTWMKLRQRSAQRLSASNLETGGDREMAGNARQLLNAYRHLILKQVLRPTPFNYKSVLLNAYRHLILKQDRTCR